MVADFKKKKNKSPLAKLILLFGIVVILGLAGLLIVADVKIYQKKRQLNAQIENLQKKLQDLEERNKNLKEGISSADDASYIEKIAREELNLQKPGEQVVSFVMPEQVPDIQIAQEQRGVSVWLGWLSGLFK